MTPPAPAVVESGVDLAPLMEIDRGMFKLTRYFQFTKTGLTFIGKPPMDVCGDLVEFLKIMDTGIAWVVGDFVNGVESFYGEESAQIVDASNLSEASIKVYRWVASRVAPTNRRPELFFQHHQEVAALEPSKQVEWLQKAIDGDDGVQWSVSRLKREIKAAETGADPLSGASAEFTVTVTCDNDADADALCRQLENLGRTNFKKKTPRE